MSFDDTFASEDLREIYDVFGVDGTVRRGTATQAIRIVVDRNLERVGEHGQVVGRVDRVRAQLSQWSFRRGDVVAWSDRLGTHQKEIESVQQEDGMESFGVLHG